MRKLIFPALFAAYVIFSLCSCRKVEDLFKNKEPKLDEVEIMGSIDYVNMSQIPVSTSWKQVGEQKPKP